jgi:adenosylcobinamide-phosphate synthase
MAALLALIFIILHLGAGLILPYQPGFLPYYYRWMHEAGLDFEKRLNRAERPQSVRLARGVAVGVVMGVLASIIGFIVWYAALYGAIGIFLVLLFLSCCVTFMTPMKVVKQIRKHLAAGELPLAIAALQPYMAESLKDEDEHTVIRKTIEFIAISLNQFLLAPIFWFIIAGPVGLSLYVTYSALRHACGLPDQRRRYFGQFARGMDTIMNILPAAVSTFFLTLSALFVSRSNPLRAAETVWKQTRSYGLCYEGWLITALAGGLGVTLGGPIRYADDYSKNYPWVGPPQSSARLIQEDLSRAALLQYTFFMCLILFISILIIIIT